MIFFSGESAHQQNVYGSNTLQYLARSWLDDLHTSSLPASSYVWRPKHLDMYGVAISWSKYCPLACAKITFCASSYWAAPGTQKIDPLVVLKCRSSSPDLFHVVWSWSFLSFIPQELRPLAPSLGKLRSTNILKDQFRLKHQNYWTKWSTPSTPVINLWSPAIRRLVNCAQGFFQFATLLAKDSEIYARSKCFQKSGILPVPKSTKATYRLWSVKPRLSCRIRLLSQQHIFLQQHQSSVAGVELNTKISIRWKPFQNTSSACPVLNTYCILLLLRRELYKPQGAVTSSCGCQTTFSSHWQVSICKSYGSLSRNDSNRKIAPISEKSLNCLTFGSTRTTSISHISHFPPPALQHGQMCPRILQLYPWCPWSSLTCTTAVTAWNGGGLFYHPYQVGICDIPVSTLFLALWRMYLAVRPPPMNRTWPKPHEYIIHVNPL